MESIRHYIHSGKKIISKEWLIITIILLVALAGFGLGRLSIKDSVQTELKIGEIELNSVSATVYKSQQDNVLSNKDTAKGNGTIVASKNSTKYHYTYCSGAKRIKEENKIYFNSIEEARSSGRTPAGNCKGLR